jgi:hypothetical protein
MSRRITTVVVGVAVMALVVAAIVALMTQTGQAAVAPDKAATAAAAQDCPAGQDCGGCASQGAGATTTQQAGDGAAQDCDGCSGGSGASVGGQTTGSGSGDCCP